MQTDRNDIQTRNYIDTLKDILDCINLLNSKGIDDITFIEKARAVKNAFKKIKEEEYVEGFIDFLWEVTGGNPQQMLVLANALCFITWDEWSYSLKIDTLLRQKLDKNENYYLVLQLKKQQDISYSLLHRKRAFIDEWNINLYFQKGIQNQLQMDFDKIPVSKRQQDFAVIVTTQLLGYNHMPTKMTLEFCKVFEKQLKMKVLLVCAMESVCEENLKKFGISEGYQVNHFSGHGFFKVPYKECKIECYQLFLEEETKKEQQDLMRMIYEKKPLFVWQFAGIPSFGSAMQQFTSYFYTKMTQGYPAVPADLIINYFQDTRKHHPDTLKMLQEKGVSVADMFFTFMRSPSKGLLNRSQFKIPEDGFCLGVAGNRLAQECTDQFLQILSRVLEQEANVFLVFIGGADQTLIDDIQRKIKVENRCFFLGFQSNPEEALALIDLYVDLPHQGGGYMGTSALSEGKPVICLKGGDVSAKAGEEFWCDSLDEYENEILRYKKDAAYYEMKSKAARNRIESIMLNEEELAKVISRTVKLGLQEM